MTIRNLEALLHPGAVWFLGEPSNAAQRALCTRLERSGAFGFRHVTGDIAQEAAPQGSLTAIVADPRFADAATITALGERGCRGVLWPLGTPPTDDVMTASRPYLLRMLGPRSVGFAVPAIGLDLTLFAQTPREGSLALIVQSQSVAAAAVDWASGRGLGFSLVAVVGGESDVDIADLLDFVALDHRTSAVAVEVGRIRGARKFMSAARACARMKPTVILQTRPDDAGRSGPDPVRSAAFARCGLVEVPTLPALFDAIAALERLPSADGGRLLVAASGAALCGLAIDAAIRQKLNVLDVPEVMQAQIRQHVASARFLPGAVDLGDAPPAGVVAALRALLEVREADAVLYVRSPSAAVSHEDMAAALADALPGPRLLTVWLGLESATAARRRSADARQSTFTSPDAAARALRYRYEYAHNRVLLTQTPPRGPSDIRDPQAIATRLAGALRAVDGEVSGRRAVDAVGVYGVAVLPSAPMDRLMLACGVTRHPELGMHVRVSPLARGVPVTPAYGFPPLDPLLADRLLEAAGLSPENGVAAPDRAAAAGVLIRLAQLVIDQPAVVSLTGTLGIGEGTAALVGDVSIQLRAEPSAPRDRLALAPYPVEQQREIRLSSGATVSVRAIRPSDEEDVVRLLESLDTESVRLRFFAYIRHFGHAMAARMTQIDYDRELGLIALDSGTPPRAIGLATLISDPDGVEAEFAVLVHQACARGGLGRRLLTQLIEHARARGLRRVVGDVLQENTAMRHLAEHLGFSARRHPHEIGCLRVELDL